MMLIAVAAAAFFLALVPAVMLAVNLRHHLVPSADPPGERPRVSVLIPARNEEDNIAEAVASVTASEGVDLEVLVLDDHSEDATAEIAALLAREDSRVRLMRVPPLPGGWTGKHHACASLWHRARQPLLVFMDADVRLAPSALRRAAGFLDARGADLVSGFPRELTGSLGEKLVIPLLHFILLGFLPIWWMRRSRHPMFASGCGQFFMARREAYEESGGYAAIRSSRADGLTLPRTFRRAGLVTDIFDGTDLMVCRMYSGLRGVWRGLAKNATEELGSPGRIGPFTLMLGGGQVLPFVLLPVALLCGAAQAAVALLAGAAALAWATRFAATLRFRQSLVGALLHPVGVAVLLAVQWYALARLVLGRPAEWKGRSYGPGAGRPKGG